MLHVRSAELPSSGRETSQYCELMRYLSSPRPRALSSRSPPAARRIFPRADRMTNLRRTRELCSGPESTSIRLPVLPCCLAVVYRRECMFLRKKKSNWSQRVQWSFLYRRYHKYFRKTQCRRERVRARACLDSHPDAGPCSVYGDITLT